MEHQRSQRRHPAVERYLERRAQDWQARVADAITAFAGSMSFVYLHVAVFAAWMCWLEPDPWPTLTLVVSLEAIFLSTFVLIGQNRQAAISKAKADHDFVEQELELKANTELTRLVLTLVRRLDGQLDGVGEEDQGPGAQRSAGSGDESARG